MAKMRNCYGLLIFVYIFQNIENAEISTNVNYQHGGWVGQVECQFHYQTGCEMSIHVDGRRITVDEYQANEEVFVSCYSSDTAIALSVSNLTYQDVQEYICLQDKMMDYATKWMVAYPDMIASGVEEEGSTVSLSCNLFNGAPLYWVFPNDEEDNRDVTIINSYNDVNTTTTIVFALESNDNFAEYKCCVEVKDGQQTDIPCATHTYRFNKVELISYTENYSTHAISMECEFGADPPPNTDYIQWGCSQSVDTTQCANKTATNSIDGYSIKSRLSDNISDNEGTYYCLYNGNVSHIFNVTIGTSPPNVTSINKQIFYSNDGMDVQLTCNIVSNLPITVTWKKSNDFEASSGSQIISSEGSYSIDTNLMEDDNWQSDLFIHPYDASVHNVNYTCEAINELDKAEKQADTTLGPSDLSLELMVTNATDNFSRVVGVCTYTSFPDWDNYQLTVVSPLDVQTLSTNTTYDEKSFIVTAYMEFLVALSSKAIIKCLAFNTFHPSTHVPLQFLFRRKTVN